MIQRLIDYEPPPTPPVVPRKPPSTEERFRRFVAENGQVVTAIESLARARKRSGQTSWSMRAAFELLRERVDLVTSSEAVPGGHRVRLNNSFTAPMTRHIEARSPDLRGFFRTR